jgi:hypothetical protein
MAMVIGAATAFGIGSHAIPPGYDVRLMKTVATIPEQLKKENAKIIATPLKLRTTFP